eukprot:m.24447 g.24447  ORF g.24447 m.24447 type:complete len:89 (-) comp7608_c0_seq1:110-376(-)
MAESITEDGLTAKLTEGLEASHVQVTDTSANRCGMSFEAVIVSKSFEGKPLLARHRMVNKCLEDELKVIHAFTQKTLTPEQYEKEKAN